MTVHRAGREANFEGVNDDRHMHPRLRPQFCRERNHRGYRQIIRRSHSYNIRAYSATITPRGGYQGIYRKH